MSGVFDYLFATDPLTIFVRSLPYRELQKKCSSAKLCATGPHHVLINRYLHHLRCNNSATVTDNNSEEPTVSDVARAAASTSKSNTSTHSTQTIVDIGSDLDSDDSASTTDGDETTPNTPPIQGQSPKRQNSGAATTHPLLKRQKTDSHLFEAFICPITLVSAVKHCGFLFLS